MKTILTSLFALTIAFTPAFADKDGDKDHDHDHHKVTGPNGGRLLFGVEPHLEFLVLKDRKVKISAYDHDNKLVPIAEQTVRLTGGSRKQPTRLKFEKQGDVLLSAGTLPDGMNFPVVLQIKPGGDAKPVLEKFQLNLEDCPECDFKEYACSCHHHHDGEEGEHKHEHKEKEKEKKKS